MALERVRQHRVLLRPDTPEQRRPVEEIPSVRRGDRHPEPVRPAHRREHRPGEGVHLVAEGGQLALRLPPALPRPLQFAGGTVPLRAGGVQIVGQRAQFPLDRGGAALQLADLRGDERRPGPGVVPLVGGLPHGPSARGGVGATGAVHPGGRRQRREHRRRQCDHRQQGHRPHRARPTRPHRHVTPTYTTIHSATPHGTTVHSAGTHSAGTRSGLCPRHHPSSRTTTSAATVRHAPTGRCVTRDRGG